MIRKMHGRSGFTLLELAIVLTVLSLLTASILAVLTQNTRRVKQVDVQARLDTIESALLNFRRLNGRLPCPADGTYAPSSQYFGVESAPVNDCTNGQTYSSGNRTTNTTPPAVNFYDGTNTVAGVVPVRTLSLPDDAMFDPWGGAFLYGVDKRITNSTGPAFTTYTVTSSTIGSISTYDGSVYPAISGTARTTSAIAVLLSFGPNGHGAYQFGGTRKSVGSNNTDEQQNCHCSNAATLTATTFDKKFVQHSPTVTNTTDSSYTFDDILRYYLRSSFLNTTDITR